MIKKLFAPVQKWLLDNKQCVGCGRPLKDSKEKNYKGSTKVFCSCGRIFIKEKDGNYRRALFTEV